MEVRQIYGWGGKMVIDLFFESYQLCAVWSHVVSSYPCIFLCKCLYIYRQQKYIMFMM